MPTAPMNFFKTCEEYLSKDSIMEIPKRIRGIYVLFKKKGLKFNVIYIGLSKTGIRRKINSHYKSKKKSPHWSHYSYFEVHDNISSQEIIELEGLLRHIYRKDSHANIFNAQRSHKEFRKIRRKPTIKRETK
jgi:hypothetical protein